MIEKLKIASKPCNQCGGSISWDKKIDNRFPTHVDNQGIQLEDGRCPKFKKLPKSKSQIASKAIKTTPSSKFNRFNLKPSDPEYILPIFQGGLPLIPRFYIGKINSNFKVLKKIIRIPPNISVSNVWRLAHGLIRKLLENKSIFSFFRVIGPTEPKDNHYIHLFLESKCEVNSKDIDSFIIDTFNSLISDAKFSVELIVTKDFVEEVINKENIEKYGKIIKTFFDALVYKIRYKMKEGEYRTTIHYEIIDANLYYFVDIGASFHGKGEPASKEDLGKFIYGDLQKTNKKFRLVKITDCLVTEHLNLPEYIDFLKYSRNTFENKGYTRKKNGANDWTIKDYWNKINEIDIPDNDIITIVEGNNEKRLFFPFTRLFKVKNLEIPKHIRYEAIQNAKEELLKILETSMEKLKNSTPTVEILPLRQVTPKYLDLTINPMIIEFANEELVKIERNQNDPNKLNRIPQELLKDKSGVYQPLAGKFDFLLIPIIPDDLSKIHKENVKKLLKDIASSFSGYNLSNKVEISEEIRYKSDKQDVYNRKHSIWGTIFTSQIAPQLMAINKLLTSKKIIALPLIGLRAMGTSSQLFKYYLQNEFYKLLQKDLSKTNFSVIQSFLVDEYKPYKGSKLAVMLYKNSLFNIAANRPNSKIAQRIQNGILFKLRYPFGTRDISRPIESIEMQAGFDASKVWGVEHSKPRGAVVVMLDPYGKQVRSKFIRDARTHKGLISESVVRELIVEILQHQHQLFDRGIRNYMDLPKKIIFLFDGDINNQQEKLFIKVYRELIESREYPILPEFIILEVLKSHPIRMYLLKNSNISDVPFGVMAMLNDKEFAIKSHIWSKRSMAQPQLYRFKMSLSQRFKGEVRYSILNNEMVNIAVQLFQSTLFNTGKSGRPLKESFVIHESHKLSQEFASKASSIGVLYYKD